MKNENNGGARPEGSYKEVIGFYQSWVQTLNHYSDLVLKIRITAITSGIIILAAAGTLLLKEENPTACRLVCGFGVVFSVVLWFMLKNYYDHYRDWLNLVFDVEREMKLPDKMCMWTRYREIRRNRPGWRVWIVRNGCSMLIIAAALAILLATFFVDVKKRDEHDGGTDIHAGQVNPMKCEVVRE